MLNFWTWDGWPVVTAGAAWFAALGTVGSLWGGYFTLLHQRHEAKDLRAVQSKQEARADAQAKLLFAVARDAVYTRNTLARIAFVWIAACSRWVGSRPRSTSSGRLHRSRAGRRHIFDYVAMRHSGSTRAGGDAC